MTSLSLLCCPGTFYRAQGCLAGIKWGRATHVLTTSEHPFSGTHLSVIEGHASDGELQVLGQTICGCSSGDQVSAVLQVGEGGGEEGLIGA